MTTIRYNKEEIFFQPNLVNDDSKEMQDKFVYGRLSAKNCGWFWVSVEVHIQNLESTQRRCMRGKILRFEY